MSFNPRDAEGHLTDEAISAFLDGLCRAEDIPPALEKIASSIEEHLLVCERCRRLVDLRADNYGAPENLVIL